jgi:hypothetical protein
MISQLIQHTLNKPDFLDRKPGFTRIEREHSAKPGWWQASLDKCRAAFFRQKILPTSPTERMSTPTSGQRHEES